MPHGAPTLHMEVVPRQQKAKRQEIMRGHKINLTVPQYACLWEPMQQHHELAVAVSAHGAVQQPHALLFLRLPPRRARRRDEGGEDELRKGDELELRGGAGSAHVSDVGGQ